MRSHEHSIVFSDKNPILLNEKWSEGEIKVLCLLPGFTFETPKDGNEAHDHQGLDVVDEVDGVGQSQLALLHDQLREGPTGSRGQGREEHHEEAGHVEHSGFVDKEEQTASYHWDYDDQAPMLEEKNNIQSRQTNKQNIQSTETEVLLFEIKT